MPHIGKVFLSGNSQAVRLPKDFRFKVSEVEITREGDALVLRPHLAQKETWPSLKAALQRGVSGDFLADGREQGEAEDRPGLEDLFK